MKIRLEVRPVLALGVSFVVLLVPLGRAQSGRVRSKPAAPQQQGDKDKDTLRLRAEEVLLPVSVRNDRGKLPTRLERTDFIVTEDDKRQQITSLQRTPANILLILDTSGEVSTSKNININRGLALKIIESLAHEDQAALITYSDKVELISPWTSDKAALTQALEWKFKPGLKAHLYDALLFAADEVLPKVTGRRSVVLLTDGVDSFVNGGFEKTLLAMHQIRATLYVVNHAGMLVRELRPRVFNPLAFWEMLDPNVRKKYLYLRQYVRELEAGEANLKGLAEETGGAVWNPENRIDCSRSEKHAADGFGRPRQHDIRVDCEMIRNQIVEEIGTEYVIAYSSERRVDDSQFHPIRVYSVRPDLKVRVRRGIYAAKRPSEPVR
jgi:VWFA-related protein